MNVTVNQIRKEMNTLVQAHDMVNSFFWGDFHRAYNEKTQFYPLVCSYLSDGAVNTNMTQMQLVVIVCDKTFKGLENLNDTESDTVTVARHLFNVIRQSPRWNNLLRVNSATLSKFYENTSDEVAGVILTMNVDIKQSRSLCDLPLDNYDFEGTFIGGGGDCEDVLIVNSDQTFTFSAESGTIVELPDAPVVVTDKDGNPLGSGNVPSVTGGVVEVTIEPCPPCENATYVLTVGGNAVDSGEIGSGQTEEIPIDAFIPPCEDATVQINGDQVATVASGGMVNIAVENESGTPLGTFDEETGVWVVPDCEDATAVLLDTDNNILSTTPIASGATENITAPDGTVTVNRDGVFFADVDVTSGGVASVNVPSGCEPDFDAENFITKAEITNTTQQSLIRDLVLDLKNQGLWAKLQAIYPMIGGTALAHSLNLRNAQNSNAAFRLTFFGGWTHASTGALPNGTNGYADTHYRPQQLISLSDFHCMVNVRNINAGATRFHIGASGAVPNQLVGLGRVSAGTIDVGCVAGQASEYSPSISIAPFFGSKIITTNTNRNARYFANGVFQANAVAQTQASPAQNILLGAVNNAGTPSFFDNCEFSFVTMGLGLTDSEALALHNIQLAFNTALGR
jgi:hypothetical protein